MHYDAVIIGAGPAGALTGYYLAEQGLKILLLEKRKIPRYKACGGGLTARAVAALPFSIDPVAEDRVFQPKMFYRNRLLFQEARPRPLITMVMRDRFDAYLVAKAVEKGIRIQDNAAFRSCSGTAGHLSVRTDQETFRTRLIIGADGDASRVGKCLGLRVRCRRMTAVEGECWFDKPHVVERYRQSVHFDFGVIPKGYGWIFPKRNHLSIGVVSTGRTAHGILDAFHAYLKLKHLHFASRIHPLRAHLIPFQPCRRNRLATERGLLVGDAAAFTDPLTGEGLYYAFRSARLAADAVLHALDRGYEHLGTYTGRMQSEFMADLICARRMSRVLYDVPFIGRRLLESRGEELSRHQMDVVSGETTYQALFRRILRRIARL